MSQLPAAYRLDDGTDRVVYRPSAMEPIPGNTRTHHGRKTHAPCGHPYTGVVNGCRRCLLCYKNGAILRREERKRAREEREARRVAYWEQRAADAAYKAERVARGLHVVHRTAVEAFWDNVMIGAPDECWPWTGARNNQRGGYGAAAGGVRGSVRAHIAAWELANDQPVPKGLQVCHRCDNPPCCNPAHLYVGTAKQNARDMVERGRSLVGDRNPSRQRDMPKGVDHPGAKLTWDDVRAIRESVGVSQRELGERYGVTPGAIGYIRRGVTWRDS